MLSLFLRTGIHKHAATSFSHNITYIGHPSARYKLYFQIMGQETEAPEDGLVHDEVEIEDFDYDSKTGTFTYPCPCGDEFVITREELLDGQVYARCPSCSLMVQVIFNPKDLEAVIKQSKPMQAVRA